jgi:carboxylesterase
MTPNRYVDAVARRVLTFDTGDRAGLVGEGDPSAISIEGDPKRPGVLAFHGFAGTPKEVRILCEGAKKMGLSASAPRLSGHTASVSDLMNVGWDDWVNDARRAVDDLAGRTNGKVVVGGLSLGALLATHVAATMPDRVTGLVALANATWLRLSTFRLPLWICGRLDLFDNRFYLPKHGADIRDDVARAAHLTYELNPIRSAIEVLRAGQVVRAELPRVRCPTLVIHGRLDRVCPVDKAYTFAQHLGTTDVEVRIMPRSGHIVSVDADRVDVARAIEAFLVRVAGIERRVV